MAWAKLKTKTLGSATYPLVFDDVIGTPKKFNQLMTHFIGAGNANYDWQLGDTTIDTGTAYAYRTSINGATDTTTVSHADIRAMDAVTAGGDDGFAIAYLINIATEEKLMISFAVGDNTAGAGYAPARQEVAGKWVETTNQQDIAQIRTGTVNLDTNSNISQIGTD